MLPAILQFSKLVKLTNSDIRHYGRTTIAFALMIIVFPGVVQPANATNRKPYVISPADLAKNPTHYIGKLIKVRDLACYGDAQTYRCASISGLDVVTISLGPMGKLNFIETKCDAGDSVKRTIDCVVALTFIPRSATLEDGFFVQKNKSNHNKIWVIQTDSARMSTK